MPEFEALRQAIESSIADRHRPASEPIAAAPPDLMAQVKQLGELRDAGLLSEEEFSAKKAELLRRLGWRRGPTGCSATSRCTWRSPSTSWTPSRAEEPHLFDEQMTQQVRDMLAEAVEYEVQFAADLLEQGVSGMSLADMREYLQHVADRRLLGWASSRCTAQGTPSRSWSCRTSRNCPTSSNGAYRPTRSEYQESWPSTTTIFSIVTGLREGD